jgi:large subunit ribosomal protein L20
MARVKRGTTKLKHRRNILARTKGMRGNIHKKERAANQALAHAGNFAFNDRRKKKGVFRALFTTRINAALREHGTTYSKFIDMLHKKDIALDRKILSTIAKDNPDCFERIVTEVQK